MKIVAVSDMHGQLPEIPACHLLLLAGDLCPVRNHAPGYQANWLDTVFRDWLQNQQARHIVGIAGNHDFVFEREPGLVPDLPWSYLQDSGEQWEGLKIWGTPWQPWFFDWAFNGDEVQLQRQWDLIPKQTDILLVHGPPQGFGDRVWEKGGWVHTGCKHLLRRIEEIQPFLVVFGHIHEGRGQWRLGKTILANVTLLDERYKRVYEPWLWEMAN